MTARSDAIGSDGPDAALSRVAAGDSPLTLFEPEPQEAGKESGDSAALLMDVVPSQAPSVPFATPSAKDGKPRTAGVVNRIKSVLRTLDITRDFEQTVDSRLAALRGLDQEVQDRAARLERLSQEINVGVAHADDILRAIETTVAAFENRAQTASTSLGRQVAGWEAREAAVVDTAEQLGRRAADTIDDLEGRVGDCEARAHIAERTITTSLTALEERLPAVGQCDQDLARIELAVPQIARQLAELENRIVDLSGSHRQLDRLEECVAQLEQRAAAAVDEVRHATRAKDELQREIAKGQQQIERLPLNTLRFRWRGPSTRREFSLARLIFGGTAFALSAAILLLVSVVLRFSPVENQRPEEPLSAVALASRALTLAPALAVAPPMPLTADISHDRPEAARPAPVPAVPVVVSETPVATRGVPTATAREQSVRKGAETPQFVGTLLIESDPAGAAAFVNQKSVGHTPVLVKNLRVGSHVVRLESEGYQRWSSAATVSAVRQERVKAKLERERSR